MENTKTVVTLLSIIILVISGSCSCEKENDSSEELPPEVFTLNAATNILVAYNSSANQVAVLDYTANISSLFNGKSGGALAFNYETGEAVFISGDSSSNTWYSTKNTFSDYFGNLPTQKNLWDYGEKNGILFDSSSITTEISEEIANILGPLSADYSTPCNAFSNYLYASKVTSDAFKSPLQGFEKVMGNVNSNLRGDFKWLIGMFQGVGAVFGKIKGGLGLLNTKGASLDFGTILTEPTGFHVLIYVLKEIQRHLDIGEALGEVLNSPDSFFSLVDKLGGKVDYGFDGFITLLSEILNFASGQTSQQNLEIILKNFLTNSKTDLSAIKDQWSSAIQDLLKAIEKLKLTDELQGLTKVLKSILDNTWYENGIGISGVITQILSAGDSLDANATVDVILKLLTPGVKVPKLI